MADDVRITHYFAALSLFTAGMLVMVTASTTLLLLFGWEAMGLCSFMLIGHWWEKKENSNAALKAFFTTRTGDIGLLVGISILFFAAGQTFDIAALNEAALTGGISKGVLTIGAIALFAGVVGKSAQFPLHTWLPDAMAGPTPVSALIHAATMVVAGVYLVARVYGVFWEGFSIAAGGVNLGAVIGGVTVLIAALLAFVQTDIKRVLAYSTVSQLGYMVMALCVGAWTAGVFHLFTHAMFKALLFLGSGSVSHAVHTFDMREMGGLRKHMPTTFKTFMIGSIALAGIPPLAGFWSKDEILVGRRRRRVPDHARHGSDRRGHDRGLHDPLRLAHLLRRVPGPRPSPRVAQGDHRPADGAVGDGHRRRIPQRSGHRVVHRLDRQRSHPYGRRGAPRLLHHHRPHGNARRRWPVSPWPPPGT